MERKYQIMSASTIMKMVVSFRDQEGISSEVSVGVDLFNNRVYFDNKNDNIDFDDLEQEILVYLRPTELEMPKMAPEIFAKIAEVQSGRYRSEKYGEL